jgi:hypothetical protein
MMISYLNHSVQVHYVSDMCEWVYRDPLILLMLYDDLVQQVYPCYSLLTSPPLMPHSNRLGFDLMVMMELFDAVVLCDELK